MKHRDRLYLLLCLLLSCLPACQSRRFDQALYARHMPRSILILPPMNESFHLEGLGALLAAAAVEVAERGYYVFPPAVVDQMMKQNGLPTAAEMHQVALPALDAVFGADAVLYMTIRDWGEKQLLLWTFVTIKMDYRLVDIKSGTEIWRREESYMESLPTGGANPQDSLGTQVLSMMLGNVLHRTIADMDAIYSRSAEMVTAYAFQHSNARLPVGPRYDNMQNRPPNPASAAHAARPGRGR